MNEIFIFNTRNNNKIVENLLPDIIKTVSQCNAANDSMFEKMEESQRQKTRVRDE